MTPPRHCSQSTGSRKSLSASSSSSSHVSRNSSRPGGSASASPRRGETHFSIEYWNSSGDQLPHSSASNSASGKPRNRSASLRSVSYTHLRAHETPEHLV